MTTCVCGQNCRCQGEWSYWLEIGSLDPSQWQHKLLWPIASLLQRRKMFVLCNMQLFWIILETVTYVFLTSLSVIAFSMVPSDRGPSLLHSKFTDPMMTWLGYAIHGSRSAPAVYDCLTILANPRITCTNVHVFSYRHMYTVWVWEVYTCTPWADILGPKLQHLLGPFL